MDLMKCRSVAALAVPGTVGGRQATAALQVTRVSLARRQDASLSRKRDWSVRASGNGSEDGGGRSTTRLNATVEKANDGGVAAAEGKHVKMMFGSSESSCDQGSSYLAVENILDSEGGNSKEDYQHRAHVFSESDVFFSALKDRNSTGLN